MAGNIYDLTTLLGVMRVQRQNPVHWLNYYTSQINFETEEIAWDRVFEDNRKLAPLVVPNVQGRVLGTEGYDTVSFKPAYVKPKHIIDPNMVLPRQPGEALATGSLNNESRRAAVVGHLTGVHRNLIQNRNEWLAARGAIDGYVIIESEDYPRTMVDFRRDPSLTSVLAGATEWDQATADPMADLKEMRRRANNLSGQRITRHIFGANAWDLFTQRVDIKDLMDTRYRGSETQVTRISEGLEGLEYMGVIQGLNGAGRIEAWVDTTKFIDPETNTEEFYLDQDSVVGIGNIQGVRCFGAIKDADALYKSMEIFIKMWRNQDPSVEYLLSQCAPLMVPRMPNASYVIKVVSP